MREKYFNNKKMIWNNNNNTKRWQKDSLTKKMEDTNVKYYIVKEDVIDYEGEVKNNDEIIHKEDNINIKKGDKRDKDTSKYIWKFQPDVSLSKGKFDLFTSMLRIHL